MLQEGRRTHTTKQPIQKYNATITRTTQARTHINHNSKVPKTQQYTMKIQTPNSRRRPILRRCWYNSRIIRRGLGPTCARLTIPTPTRLHVMVVLVSTRHSLALGIVLERIVGAMCCPAQLSLHVALPFLDRRLACLCP